jgi:hypothetical protein
VRQLVAALLVIGNDLRHLVGDEIHVLHGEHRKLEAHHAANLARPQAAAVHHMLGVDVALAVMTSQVPSGRCFSSSTLVSW